MTSACLCFGINRLSVLKRNKNSDAKVLQNVETDRGIDSFRQKYLNFVGI